MEVVVPSIGRAHDVRTIETLCAAGLSPLVVTWPAQAKEYVQAVPSAARVVACKVKGIALTRQWILDNVPDNKIIMLDDDVSFHKRRDDDPTKFTNTTTKDVAKLFKIFEKHLDKYAHISIVPRQGGNRILEDQICGRPSHVFGYDVARVKASGAKFHKGQVQDDFDMTLQLLRRGLANRIVASYVVDQHAGHGAAGGTSSYRTVEIHNASVMELAARHSGFVRVRQADYSSLPDGWGQRLETTIAWKKAFASAPAC